MEAPSPSIPDTDSLLAAEEEAVEDADSFKFEEDSCGTISGLTEDEVFEEDTIDVEDDLFDFFSPKIDVFTEAGGAVWSEAVFDPFDWLFPSVTVEDDLFFPRADTSAEMADGDEVTLEVLVGRGGSGLSSSKTETLISSTKLSGKTPILPFSSPLNHPWSSISLEMTLIMSPSLIVNSSSFWAS